MITLNLKDFKKAIQQAEFVENKTLQDVLSCCKIEAKDGKMSVMATDLELAYKTIISDVEGKSSFCVNTKKLSKLINKVDSDKVNLNYQNNNTGITFDMAKTKININSFPINDFPEIPEKLTENVIEIKSVDFLNAIKKVFYAVSTESTRYFLNGIFFEIGNGKMNLVATDGRRLSFYSLPVETDFEQSLIVPSKTITFLSRILKDDVNMKISMNDKQIFFEFGNVFIVSNTIDGTYPNYRQVIPTSYETEIELSKDELLTKVERVEPLVDEKSSQVIWDISESNFKIQAVCTHGKIVDDIDIQSNANLKIGLNYKYCLDILRNGINNSLVLQIVSENNPIVFKDKSDENFTGVIMPMKINVEA